MNKEDNSAYLLKSELLGGELTLSLDILDSQTGTKVVKCFSKNYNDSNLPEQVKKNFKDVSNVNSIINQSPQSCKINTQVGVITLTYHVVFPNGNKFQLLSNIQLQQKQVPQQINTKVDQELMNKIAQLQLDIQKMYKIIAQSSKQKNYQLDGLIKQIHKQVSALKISIEETHVWKKQQQIKYRQLVLLYHTENNKEKQQKSKVGISDQMMHVFDEKIDELRQNFSDKLQKQAQKIQDLKDSSVRHQKIIDRLTQQNIELKKMIKALQEKSSVVNDKHEAIQANITELKTKSQRLIKKLSSHQQELQQVKSQINTSPKKKEQNNPDLLFNLFSPMHQPKPNINPMQSPKSQDKTLLVQPMLIHPQSGYSKQFVNTGKAIAYNGVTQQPTQLIGKLKISTQRLSFITITKSKQNQIGFGVLDAKYINERNSIQKQNYIMLGGSNGALYDAGSFVSTNGNGFKQGDKIKMRVNTVQGFIQWAVDGIVVCKHKSNKLKNQQIQWFPFVRMCDRGDTIKWTLQ